MLFSGVRWEQNEFGHPFAYYDTPPELLAEFSYFQAPDEIVWARIDRKTGLLADGNTKDTVFQAFLVDTVPTETSRSATSQTEGRRLLRMDDL